MSRMDTQKSVVREVGALITEVETRLAELEGEDAREMRRRIRAGLGAGTERALTRSRASA
jgi:hypothetical protein